MTIKRRTRPTTVVATLLAAVLVASAAFVGLGSRPAGAEVLGDLVIDPETGELDETFFQWSVDDTCPTGTSTTQLRLYGVSHPVNDGWMGLSDTLAVTNPLAYGNQLSPSIATRAQQQGVTLTDGTYDLKLVCRPLSPVGADLGEWTVELELAGTSNMATATYTVVEDDPEPPPPGEGDKVITLDVPEEEPEPGTLVMTIADGDDEVTMTEAVRSGDGTRIESTGTLKAVTVTDTRAEVPGWTISGQVQDFTGPTTLDGKYLGWDPSVTSQEAGQNVQEGALVEPGFESGNGLKDSRTLASAEAGDGLGEAVLDADLDLVAPGSTPEGTYTTTLTLTLISG